MKQVLKKLLITMIVMILLSMASSQAATYAYNIYVKNIDLMAMFINIMIIQFTIML